MTWCRHAVPYFHYYGTMPARRAVSKLYCTCTMMLQVLAHRTMAAPYWHDAGTPCCFKIRMYPHHDGTPCCFIIRLNLYDSDMVSAHHTVAAWCWHDAGTPCWFKIKLYLHDSGTVPARRMWEHHDIMVPACHAVSKSECTCTMPARRAVPAPWSHDAGTPCCFIIILDLYDSGMVPVRRTVAASCQHDAGTPCYLKVKMYLHHDGTMPARRADSKLNCTCTMVARCRHVVLWQHHDGIIPARHAA